MRTVQRIIHSVATSDGGGVRLRRSIGGEPGRYVDPFLMLDEFFSDDPRDYLAGFPAHPHRGFETVTYMLDGHMRHEDHLGNRGDLGPGDVQWMTAAGGIIHSEMPQQTEGRMRGFQLWLNLPAAEKMQPARYRDIPAREIPSLQLASGALIKVIAGTAGAEGRSVSGPVNRPGAPLSTDPLYVDIVLPAQTFLELPLAQEYSSFVYVYDGDAVVGPEGSATRVGRGTAAVLSPGAAVRISAQSGQTRALLLAARALHEPIVQYGPFVMNTRSEIEQAVDDFRRGRLVGAGPAS